MRFLDWWIFQSTYADRPATQYTPGLHILALRILGVPSCGSGCNAGVRTMPFQGSGYDTGPDITVQVIMPVPV